MADQPAPSNDKAFRGGYLDILAEILGAAVTLENEETPEAFQRITEIGARLLGTQRASIWFYNDTYSEIACQDLYERNADRHSRGESLAASVFPSYTASHRLGRVIAAGNVRTDPRTKEIPAAYYDLTGISSLLDAPVWVRGRLAAVLSFEQVGSKRSWSRNDEQIAQILAAYTANLMEAAERRRAEHDREQFLAALRKSEALYRSIFRSSPDAISISRVSDDLYLDVNEGFTRITGYSRDEVVGRTSRELRIWVNPGDRKQLAAALKERGEATNMEFPFRIKSGEIVWGLISSAILAVGDEVHIQSVIRDITTLKAAQAEREAEHRERLALERRLLRAQKLESLGTLAGGIAHDFNNLLMGIQGNASLLLMDLPPCHPHRDKLRHIEEQIASGADLTRQLLGFARGGRYEVKPTAIRDIVRKSAAMFGRTQKHVVVHDRLPADLWTVEVDRAQMEQVFMNLFVNAGQAMANGGDLDLDGENCLMDEMRTSRFEISPGPYVKLSVSDTGTGMDEATLARVFDPFFSTKEMGRGTGLGLATVYGIVRGHRGMINVYSEPGRGTTFSLYLPASRKPLDGEAPPRDQAVVRGCETILLVDDETMIREVSREMLENLGYTC